MCTKKIKIKIKIKPKRKLESNGISTQLQRGKLYCRITFSMKGCQVAAAKRQTHEYLAPPPPLGAHTHTQPSLCQALRRATKDEENFRAINATNKKQNYSL